MVSSPSHSLPVSSCISLSHTHCLSVSLSVSVSVSVSPSLSRIDTHLFTHS